LENINGLFENVKGEKMLKNVFYKKNVITFLYGIPPVALFIPLVVNYISQY
jgi:hypothetical protein